MVVQELERVLLGPGADNVCVGRIAETHRPGVSPKYVGQELCQVFQNA